jgi:hypothetical protein
MGLSSGFEAKCPRQWLKHGIAGCGQASINAELRADRPDAYNKKSAPQYSPLE